MSAALLKAPTLQISELEVPASAEVQPQAFRIIHTTPSFTQEAYSSAFQRSMMKFIIPQHYGRFAYDSAASQPNNQGS